MEENKNEKIEGEIKLSTPILKKLENFWYHYKWHTLICLFLVVTILICSLQMCTKEEYDTYIMYAGDARISRTAGEGDGISDYGKIISALKGVSEDYDGNGKVSVSFLTYYALTAEQIEEIKASLKEGEEFNPILDDMENLNYSLLYSEYYVCFLSPEIYEKYRVYFDTEIFAPLDRYASDGREYDYYDKSAIKLSSDCLSSFRSLAGINALPEDTLICLRAKSELSDSIGSEKNSKNFEHAEEVMRKILAY